ncbi:MAG: hypothetical protein K2M46_07760 [Lachnospiraceae bacterium]|nr:hypothetical protein [Lachnospiraceae bacterium]
MIMGYAERIVNNQNVCSQIKGQAACISRQSIKIKELSWLRASFSTADC